MNATGSANSGDAQAASMYFVAVLCPETMDGELRQFKTWMRDRFGCTAAMKSPAHITLVKPFWLEKNWEEYLLTSFSACNTGMTPFEVKLQGFSHFGKRVIYVDVVQSTPLSNLKRKVESHFTRTFGDHLKKEQLGFQPHVTIASRDLRPGDFDKAWERFQKEEYTRQFMVEAFHLLRLEEGKWKLLEARALDGGNGD